MEILSEIGINLFPWDFQGIHRLPEKTGMSHKPVLAKFVSRETAEFILDNKKKFCDLQFCNVDLPVDTRIFVNRNLSIPYREIDFYCRKLI